MIGLLLMVSMWLPHSVALPGGSVSVPAFPGGQISIWGLAQSVKRGYLTGAMLDTFDNHIQIEADTNISVGVMTQDQLAILIYDVRFGKGMPYNTIAFYNGTRINFWFNDGAGCADYAYIVYNNNHSLGPFKVNPNVTAVYNPAKNLTGVCKR